MNEGFEKEFAKLSEKDKREVNNLIRFMQEKKYHDKQYEKLLNQYIELSRDYDYLQSKIDKAIEFVESMKYCGQEDYFYDNKSEDSCGDDNTFDDSKNKLLDILKENK